ncbi:MAG: trypsin-like peptidase domain-containing protein [Acidobacteriaceae bacterium]|jgi:serine protease Do
MDTPATPDTPDTPRTTTPPSLLARIRNHRLSTTFALLATLSIGVLAGSILTRSVSGKEQGVDSSDARPLVIPSPKDLSNGFARIAKDVGPAVVNINTETLPKQSTNLRQRRRGQQLQPNTPDGGDDQNPGEDFLRRFFGDQGNGQDGDDDSAGSGTREALGSGFIVDSRGYIITNNHVVDKADKIYVKLSTDPDNDKGRPAKVIGVDAETDIAVIKIEAPEPLPTVKLGNSEGAQVGDWVLAIGSPFSLSETVTAGIVSAKNRSIDEPGPDGVSKAQFQRFIQTDAAINPGNSGGPLVDMAGQVIGMNTAIYTQSMGSEGVGFAMPSNTVASVYNMLIGPEHKVTRGSIGIGFDGSPNSAETHVYGYANGGVRISNVYPGTPAAKAGLQPFDVIVSIDGKPIKDGDQLVADISSRKIGSTVQMGYQRNGTQHTVSVGIADRGLLPSANSGAPDDNSAPAEVDAGEGKLGITVTAVPASISSKIGIKGGVIVNSVRPGSFADEINMPKGAIITEIDTVASKRPVTDENAYRSIVSSLKSGEDVAFVVRFTGADAPPGIRVLAGTLP